MPWVPFLSASLSGSYRSSCGWATFIPKFHGIDQSIGSSIDVHLGKSIKCSCVENNGGNPASKMGIRMLGLGWIMVQSLGLGWVVVQCLGLVKVVVQLWCNLSQILGRILLRFDAVSPKLETVYLFPSAPETGTNFADLATQDCLQNDVGVIDFLATKDPVVLILDRFDSTTSNLWGSNWSNLVFFFGITWLFPLIPLTSRNITSTLDVMKPWKFGAWWPCELL